ncbi:MAG: carboxypeptidase-like regulatory domain-containing protein [Bacteroidota bacterium]
MENKTKFKRTKEWFENRWLFVAIAIFFVGFLALSKFLKAAKEMKDLVTPEALVTDTLHTVVEKRGTIQIALRGKVLDENQEPIPNASIEIAELIGVTSLTDHFGNFEITSSASIEGTLLELVIMKEGFQTLQKKVSIDQYNHASLGVLILKRKEKTQPKKPTNEPAKAPPRETPSPDKSAKTNFINPEFNNSTIITNPTAPIEITNNISLTKDTIKND